MGIMTFFIIEKMTHRYFGAGDHSHHNHTPTHPEKKEEKPETKKNEVKSHE